MSARIKFVLAVLFVAVAACQAIDDAVGTKTKSIFKSETGVDADTVISTAKKVSASLEELTPEQEYYIGRAVAAEVLSMESVLDDDEANAYVNRVGQLLAQASDRPDVFGGYHFFILDTEERNALAAPGAFIFITRGLLRLCATEDQLAAVLAHEIVHVVNRDGIRVMQKSERIDVLVDLGTSNALATGDIPALNKALGEIAGELTSKLVTHGYGRGLEAEADRGAVALLAAAGYRPAALTDLLTNLKASGAGSRTPALMRTHASIDRRIDAVAGDVRRAPAGRASPQRQQRFERALAAARR